MTARPPSSPPRAPGPPPVDELSDIAWARVERRLWTELDRAPVVADEPPRSSPDARRRWPWLMVGAVAAAIVAVLAWPTPRRPLTAPASRVVTTEAATEVSYGDAAITIAPRSAVVMQGQADHGVAILLERGRATFAVAPRVGRPPFVVLAGAVQVRVVGTRFTVTRSGDDARVDVAHGEVEVVAWGRREVLLDGASWSSDGVREAAGERPVTIPNPGGVAAAHFSPSVPAPAQAPSRPSPPPSVASVAPVLPAAPAAPPSAPAVAERRAAFEAAAALEVSDPAAALRAYRQVASGTDAWAANALFAAARLAFGQGDRDLAARFARSYLTRFSTGANAADARDLLDRSSGVTP